MMSAQAAPTPAPTQAAFVSEETPDFSCNLTEATRRPNDVVAPYQVSAAF